jgi:hypothetical protein
VEEVNELEEPYRPHSIIGHEQARVRRQSKG